MAMSKMTIRSALYRLSDRHESEPEKWAILASLLKDLYDFRGMSLDIDIDDLSNPDTAWTKLHRDK